MKVFAVARDLLLEAATRKWMLALVVGVTLALGLIGLSLRFDVVDGALTATRLFGKPVNHDIQAADVVLRPLFQSAAYVVFYGGMGFGILTTSDFAPTLLSPGRVEFMVALPVRRYQLLAGTLVGVLVISSLAALYGAGGLVLILGLKTGLWNMGPLWAALLASVSFTGVYAAMLATAVFVRSAALSTAVGAFVFGLGIVASYRAEVVRALAPGVLRTVISLVLLVVPRVQTLAEASADLAVRAPAPESLWGLVGGVLVFAAAAFAIGAWQFERKDV